MIRKVEMMKTPGDGDKHCNYINRIRPDYIYGKDMHDHVTNSVYDEWCRWNFPEGVAEMIEDDKLYLVWYELKESSDPKNSSMTYDVYYIEMTPSHIQEALEKWKELCKTIEEYRDIHLDEAYKRKHQVLH